MSEQILLTLFVSGVLSGMAGCNNAKPWQIHPLRPSRRSSDRQWPSARRNRNSCGPAIGSKMVSALEIIDQHNVKTILSY